MFLVGWVMVFLIWGYLMIFLKPEKNVIHGLKDKVKRLSIVLIAILSIAILTIWPVTGMPILNK